eukprot:s2313_g17.t2
MQPTMGFRSETIACFLPRSMVLQFFRSLWLLTTHTAFVHVTVLEKKGWTHLHDHASLPTSVYRSSTAVVNFALDEEPRSSLWCLLGCSVCAPGEPAMEVGGRGALTTFRRPLTESSADVDIEVGMDRERSREEPGHQPHFAMRGTASSPRASSPHGRAGTSPKSNMPRPAAASGRPQNMGRQRSAQTAGEALVAAALSGAGRRLPGLGAASRRAPATRQTVNEVRRQLDENLQKDGECYAVCMAGGLDLASLAEASAPTTEVARASAAAAAAGRELSQLELPSEIRGGSQSSLAGPRQLDNGLGGGLVRHFGTGENIVLHLQFFGQKDVFAFGFGCIVCWSLEPNELDQIRNAMKPFLVRPQERSGFEEETMNFLFKRKDEVEADDGADDGDEPAQEAKCISQDKLVRT